MSFSNEKRLIHQFTLINGNQYTEPNNQFRVKYSQSEAIDTKFGIFDWNCKRDGILIRIRRNANLNIVNQILGTGKIQKNKKNSYE